MKRVIVTGAAGFVGFHFVQALCAQGYSVFGVDNLNDYNDVSLKHARLNILKALPEFSFERLDLSDRSDVEDFFSRVTSDVVVNLAAQAGVRYSIENPHAYVDSNLQGFLNVLEGCRHSDVEHLIFASSSSVYGANTKVPFATADNVDHPVSLYAATKKSNELMAHTYAHLYGLPCTGLRFFTVYGPWGRPDMAYFKFVKAINDGTPIEVYNHGDMKRDFTYVDDVVESMVRLVDMKPSGCTEWDSRKPDPSRSMAPYRIYNIGNNNPETLEDFIVCIEEALGQKAEKIMKDMQPGDVYATFADTEDLAHTIGFKPSTPLKEGIDRFVEWYKSYY